jgi:uncharacterized protein YpiB (UPF0302 family)
MYVDHFKSYQEFFGEVVERMVECEKRWKQAEILNKIDCALATKDKQWFMELQQELKGWQ